MHAKDQVTKHLENISTVTFVPFARPGGLTHEQYTALARQGLEPFGKKVVSVNDTENPKGAIENAEAVFIGGGNTFLLLRGLYETGLIDALRARAKEGMPYMGTSAGSNVAGLTINNTNDMPIVYPPSFDAMQLIPFNINPHFPSVKKDPNHMGESREDRIHEFTNVSKIPVVGIREDSMIRREGDRIWMEGGSPGIIFRQGAEDQIIAPGTDLSNLS